MMRLCAPGVIALVVLAATAANGSASAGSAAAATASGRVTVCHVARADRERERTRRVSARAARALLRRTPSYAGPCFDYGDARRLGDGRVTTYAQTRGHRPLAIGATFGRGTMRNLPREPHDGHHCYDVDGNGTIDRRNECAGGHERILFLPRRFRKRVDSPFQWLLMNWNTIGHIPPRVYTAPHFDFHFVIMDLARRNTIGEGPCGLIADCEDFARGRVPVPDAYRPRGYTDVGAVEGGMGNHLFDLSRPEHHNMPFSHTFIYGAYEGDVTFYEPMITLDWFQRLVRGSIANRCFALKLPMAWERSGWYPTTYCIRYRPNRDDYTVSLERFVYRRAVATPSRAPQARVRAPFAPRPTGDRLRWTCPLASS